MFNNEADTWTKTETNDGKLTITGLEWGKYRLVETKPLEGYAIDKTPHDFEIGKDSLDWTAGILKNAKIQLVVLPTNSTSDQADVSGHRMRLSGRFRNMAAPSSIEWDETEEGYVVAGMLIPGEVYTLEETEALSGYGSGKRFQFKYNGYGQIEAVSEDGTVTVEVGADGIVKLVQTVQTHSA